MEILISNRQNKRKISSKKIQERTKAILDALGCHDAELSLLILDDTQIEDLNETYLNRKGPTNVIAFPMQEGEFTGISPNLLGDVVISVETAQKEADHAGISFELRFDQLLVHGILHLLGYDHENDEKKAAEMASKSLELFEIIG